MKQEEVELKAVIEDLINKLLEIINLKIIPEVLKKILKKNYDEGIEQAEVQFGMNFFEDSEKLGFLEKYTFDNIKGMTDEIADKLRKELSQGLMNLESISQLQKRVESVMDVGEERARMIARTETNRAKNMGHLDGARQSGLDVVKRWDAHLDNRTSAVCKALNGKEVPLDDKFVYEGQEFDAPPAHVNCRSTLIFIQKD